MLRLLLGQWELKVLSLAIAVGLWFFVATAQRTEIALAVPVEYVGVEGPLTLEGVHRDTVDVQVQATRWAAARVSPATVRVWVDLTGLREGDNRVRLLPEAIQVPPGVRVTRVAPAWLTVHLARAATRTVPVLPQVHGTPARGHALRRVTVDPPVVEIRGPRSTIEARTGVETLPVDVSGRREAVTQTVGLAVPDSVYPVDRRTVQVTVDIRPEDAMQQAAPGEPRR
jgi:YbbR domain-containing protein